MIEQFIVFTKGGLVLFQTGLKNLPGEPVAQLIQNVLLEAIYQRLLSHVINYVDELLDAVSHLLINEFGSQLSKHGSPPKSNLLSESDFSSKFQSTLSRVTAEVEKRRNESKSPASFWDTKKGQELIKNKGAVPDVPSKESSQDKSPSKTTPKRLSKAEKAAEKRAEKAAANKDTKKDTKKGRSWTDRPADVNLINKSEDNGEISQQEVVEVEKITFEDVESSSDHDDSSDDDDDTSDTQASSSSQKSSSFGGLFKFITGLTQKELNEENLKPVMEEIKSHLISKNVASDIADRLCESVSQSLIGRNHGNFKSISATVKAAMAEALTRILTPKRHIDISREIQAAKDAGRPYSIVFVGVNGVGKSTTLAKVCAWLLKQKHQAMIAACDTFRSGAVEQLKVHSRALGNVPIFDQGYGKDAAHIAQQAIAKATTDGIDVVLIDTAGRMQDNEPLMAALAKLVKINKPDLILFVGEALVGNDSVDQLTKFNRALEEYGDLSNPRLIDGIVLTKFDTVDDKVGAAISMVYTTGQPIVFVGVGQTYADLRTLNVKKIVDILARGRT